MTAPLAGIIVVAIEQAVAAPFATRQLADLGATVLKIERPGEGDFARSYDAKVGGQSGFFVWCNRAKQSIELDLRDERDAATLRTLVAGADVVIQNLSHAAARRNGVDAEGLVARHPHLIACDISGYGGGGPRTDDKAYDLAIQAEAGAMMLTGSADEMSKVGFSAADIAAGMYALTSILAALHRRAITGVGAAIEVSMLESLAEWTAAHVYTAAHTGVVPKRSGHRHALIAPYGLFGLADGRQVLVAVQSDREFRDLAAHVLLDPDVGDDPRFATNADRIAHVDELEAVIAGHLLAAPADEIVARLDAARVAYAFARDALEVWHHEQLRARDRIVDIATPTGPAQCFRSPFNISDAPEPPATLPALGDHDPDLLAELARRARGRESGPPV